MNERLGSKRRSTRNKTIVFDSSMFIDETKTDISSNLNIKQNVECLEDKNITNDNSVNKQIFDTSMILDNPLRTELNCNLNFINNEEPIENNKINKETPLVSKRRSTRNKTIVFDSNMFAENESNVNSVANQNIISNKDYSESSYLTNEQHKFGLADHRLINNNIFNDNKDKNRYISNTNETEFSSKNEFLSQDKNTNSMNNDTKSSLFLDDNSNSKIFNSIQKRKESLLNQKNEQKKGFSVDNEISNRSFCFEELMNAFKTIEKKVEEEKFYKNNIINKFNSEESKVKYDLIDSPKRLDLSNIPKLINNPFLKKDQESNSYGNFDLNSKKSKKF